MEPRNQAKPARKAPEVRREGPQLPLVRREEGIAPKLATNHNETLVRDSAKAGPKMAQPRKGEKKGRFRVVGREERIAPRIVINHNEAMVRDRPANAR